MMAALITFNKAPYNVEEYNAPLTSIRIVSFAEAEALYLDHGEGLAGYLAHNAAGAHSAPVSAGMALEWTTEGGGLYGLPREGDAAYSDHTEGDANG